MRRFGFGPQGMAFLRNPSSQVDLSFEDLALPLLDSLHNFARWIARNPNDAEDLVQETYLKALRGFASFQPGTNFKAWMFQILRNTCWSSCSKLERRMTVAADSEEKGPGLSVENETPETLLMKRTHYTLLQNAIENLPVHHREVLLLCEVEEMLYREIAEILSIPTGTVMSRLSRARKAVRESLRGGPESRPSKGLFHTVETPTKGLGAIREITL
jgi:RNA polymerase sigma factor (sigma-70 family)